MKSCIRIIRKKKKRLCELFIFLKYLLFPVGRKVFLFGTPNHNNIGDSAITYAELLLLNNILKKDRVKELTVNEITRNLSIIKKYNRKKNLICGHGGGNLGNLWYNEELFRYSFIDAFPQNPILIFPQTVFFTNDEKGDKAIKESKKHYEKHRELTIVAREKKSLELLNGFYKTPHKLLSPDIVLSTTMEDYGVNVVNRSGGLLVFRNDTERMISDTDKYTIVSFLDENGYYYRNTDMYSDEPITKENRMEVVRKKMQEFADVEFVITDRLHGMIFAALTGTPCIVLSNNHHKVKETYEWISYLDYIEFANNADEAIMYLPKLTKMKNCYFDKKPLVSYFEALTEEIKKYVN